MVAHVPVVLRLFVCSPSPSSAPRFASFCALSYFLASPTFSQGLPAPVPASMVSALWKACSEGNLENVSELLKEASFTEIEINGA